MATDTTTLRVPVQLRDQIAALADERGTTMLDVVAEAIRRLSRDQWWAGVHAAIEGSDPDALAGYHDEARVLDHAVSDGIE